MAKSKPCTEQSAALSLPKGRSIKNSTELLFDTIFDAMHEKKAEDILLLDLTKIKGANFDYFIITHGNSTTQVNAIAEEIRRKVKTILRMNPTHAEGFQNSEWILLDYLDVVVHVFQQEIREHYQLENLWADAVITPIIEEIPVKKAKSERHTREGGNPPKTKGLRNKPAMTAQKDTTKKVAKKEPIKKSTKNNERKPSKSTKSTAKPATKPKSKSTKSATKKA